MIRRKSIMTKTFKHGLVFSSVIAAAGLLTACSSVPLTCDHPFASTHQIQVVHAVTAPAAHHTAKHVKYHYFHISKPSDIKHNIFLHQMPATLSLASHQGEITKNGFDKYTLTIPTNKMKAVLAVVQHDPNYYAVTIHGNALNTFYKTDSKYLTHNYKHAVMTSDQASSKIVDLDSASYNGTEFTYQFTTDSPISVGKVHHLTFTAED